MGGETKKKGKHTRKKKKSDVINKKKTYISRPGRQDSTLLLHFGSRCMIWRLRDRDEGGTKEGKDVREEGKVDV